MNSIIYFLIGLGFGLLMDIIGRIIKKIKTKSIRCLFGIHKWKYDSSRHDANRSCDRCGHWEQPIYDMAYGCTYYIKK